MDLNDKVDEIEESLKDFYEQELSKDMCIALKAKKYEELLTITNELIESDPELGGYYFYRGIAKYKLGFLRAAAVDFTNCLEIDAELYFTAYYYRGICNDCIMDFEKAAMQGYKPAKEILKKIAKEKQTNKGRSN